MGAPSQAQAHSWTDQVAAIMAKDLAGFDSELSGKTNTSLWAMIDTSGDPAVENGLGSYAQAIDEHSLPENYAAALLAITGRRGYQDFARGLATLVQSVPGGGYASLQAYLAAVSAQVHPLFAELVRTVLGESAFANGSDITEVFAPNYQSRAADRVYQGADGALLEETTDAASAGTADVTLFAANGNALYIGSRYKFTQLVVALSTLASGTITPTIEYWNGNAWTAVPGLTDNSVGFTKNDTIKWTLPADWVRSYKDKGGANLSDLTPLYYLRISRGAAVLATPPVGTCVRIIPRPVLYGATGHLGVDQPPLAICRITGANTVVVESIVDVDVARFREPGTRLRALTPIAGNLTPTVAYTDQAGNADAFAQGAWASPAALDNVAVTLNGGDTGVRGIPTAGHSIVTTATQGVFEIYAPALRTPAV